MNKKNDTIRRVHLLKEYDIKETPAGRQVVFSIKFVKENGELVFLPRAVASGLRFNSTAFRMRGVLPVDMDMQAAGHVYPVNIDLIVEWNGKKVIL